MNAEKILKNKSTYYNLTQEFNLSDTLTNLIREELEINSDSSELFNVNCYNNLKTLDNVGNLPAQDVNNERLTCTELKPVDFNVSSCFKSSPTKISATKNFKNVNGKTNPRRLGYSKKRRSRNINKRNLTTNESLKQGADVNHHTVVASNFDNESKEIKTVGKLISNVENENIFSEQMILEKDNQRIVDDSLYNLNDSISLKKSSNNVEKEIDIDKDCNKMQNGNILSTSMIHETCDESILNTSNHSENIEDIQRYIEQTRDKNKISTPVQEKINETTTVENFNNSDQEFIIEEEFFIDDQPVCDVRNENMILTSINSEENNEPMVVDSPGSLDKETVIKEKFTINNNKPICNLKETNILLRDNDTAHTLDHKTNIKEKFIIDNKPNCDSKGNNIVSIPMAVKENYETAGKNINRSEQKTDIKKKLIINNNKPMNDLKEESMVLAQMDLEENDNSDGETVIEEEFTIDNNPICDKKTNNIIPIPMTVEENYKTAGDSNINNVDNSDLQTDIEKKLTINNNEPICDLKKNNMASIPMTVEKNVDNSDQETVTEKQLVTNNNKPISDLKDENVVTASMILEKNFKTAIDSTISMSTVHEKNVEETNFDNSDQETVIEEEFTIDNDPICDRKKNNMVSKSMTIEENYETTGDNDDNSDQENVNNQQLVINNSKPMSTTNDEMVVPASIILEKTCETAVDSTISIPIAQENNVEETAVEDFDNSDQEFIIEEEFTIEERPIFCDLQYEHKVSTSMTPEENHEMTPGNDVGSSDQEIIIEEEIVINDFIDNVQSENSVSIPAAVDNAYNSEQESFINKSDDLQNEDILPALLNFMDNNSITVLDNTDCLDTEKDLNKFIDEVSSENLFAIPITPEKSNHGGSEKSDHVFITPVKRLNKNSIGDLTPLSLEGLNSDDEYDKLCNEKFLNPSHNFQQRSIRSDSEYERMCEVIPNNSMEEAKFNYETSDLLNFNDIDQSINDKLADLLRPPETNSRSRKNQDYMITVDPLIDRSTSGGSLSDMSDESDLGIEVKSRHIKKVIKKNAERKKFFKIQNKSHSAQSSNSVVENEDKCTKETRYRTRRKRLRSNGSINYNEDTGDSLDDNLRKKVNKPKVKRTKKSYSNIEGRRSSRLLKKSTNKENSQDGKGDCVNNVNSINKDKKLPVIRLRRINSLKPQDSNNQENGGISEKNPENYVWAMNFDGSFNENDQSSFKDNQSLNSNDMIAEVNESVTTKFFSDEENQRSYNQLTNLSIMNIDDHLSEKLITNDVVNTKTESLDGKSNDKNRENNEENITNLNSLTKTNLEFEKEEVFSPISRGLLHESSPCEKELSVEFGKQPCNEIQENMEVDQPAEETTECRLQDTSFVGKKIKISERMKEYLNDTYQSDIDGNLVSSSTEKCCTEKSPSKLKVHNNSKSSNVPTSSNDNKLIESEFEISDANDNHDSDSSDPSFCRMSEKSNDSESTNPDEIDGSKKKLMKKLMFLKVKLEHKVPKQHQLERNTADPITPKLKAEFRKYAELQTGQFTAEENKILQRNWDRFCEVHKLDPSCVTLLLQKYNPIKSLIGYMKDRTKLLQFLARDLPNRLLNKVYRRFRYLYAERKKIKQKPNIHQFLIKEDRMIMNYMNDEDEPDVEKKLNKLSKLLKRPESIILERYNTLKNGQNTFTGERKKYNEWDILRADKFIKEFMDLSLTEDVEELRYARIPHCIWVEMEKRLKLPKLKLKKFWFHQLHLQLFNSKPIFSSDLKIMLIEYLYVKGISSRDQIDWSVAAEHFDNYVTSECLRKIFTILLSRVPIKDKEKNLLECIEWMYENKIPEITEAKYDYHLPRLAYKDGKLEIIDDYCNGNDSELSSD
ncbi:uncharacterized protein MAL13P1.304-like [Cotesia glomerata]|uniref:uncharacterized protein MAL13P1.304-like n=1 Tax=Cotesia glomerata TaxID=32391 RepID=UPI001D01D346|nr:uncharacterized protein MAL13P1.304-like [Cotesia glomerata]